MKKWYESKTLWFNVAFIVLAGVGAALQHFGYADFQPGEEVISIAVAVVAIVNMILRKYFTNTAIK